MSDVFRLFGSLALRGQEEFEHGLEKAEQQGQRTSTALDTAFRRIATSVAAAFSVTAVTNFTRQIVQASATVSARTAQFNATFKAVSESATEMFNRVSAATNVMAERLQTAGTKAFSQFTGAGLDANEALRYTERYLNLAADAAAYFDISLEDADVRLRSFIRGNVEAGDMIGLFTSETQRNSAALEEYGKKYIECTEAQKQMIMLNIADEIYRQSGAIGQAQREGEAWENTIGNLREAWLQFSAALGRPVMNALIPIVQALTGSLVTMAGTSTDTESAFNDLITASENLKTAQENAKTSTDALTAALENQASATYYSSLRTFIESYRSDLSALESLNEDLEKRKNLLAESEEDLAEVYRKYGEDFNYAEAYDAYSEGGAVKGNRLFREYGITAQDINKWHTASEAVIDYNADLEALTNEQERLNGLWNDYTYRMSEAIRTGKVGIQDLMGADTELYQSVMALNEVYQATFDTVKEESESLSLDDLRAGIEDAAKAINEDGILSNEAYTELQAKIDALQARFLEITGQTYTVRVNVETVQTGRRSSTGLSSGTSDQEQRAVPSVLYSDSDAVLQDMENNINTADRLKKIYGELGIEYDANAAKIRSYRNALEDLASLGFQPGSAAVDDIISKMNELGGSTETFEDKFQNTASKIANGFSTAASYATSFFSSLFNLQNQNWEQQQAQIDEELEAMEEKYEKEREMAEDSYEKESEALLAQLKYGDLTQEEYAEKKKALDDSYEQSKQESLDAEAEAEEELMAKKDEIARKAFDAQKMQQIAQVLIQGATAIMTAFAQLGPIGGAIASAAIAATTGVQTATIAAQQYTPMLARGGIVDGPTHIIAGEAGAEAIVPLENNTEWTSAVADLMAPKLDASDKSSADSLREEVRTLRAMLADYLPRILGKSEKIVLDTGALVGATAGAMDTQLGIISRKRARGR